MDGAHATVTLMVLLVAAAAATHGAPSGDSPQGTQARISETGLEVDQHRNLQVLVVFSNQARIDLTTERIQTRVEPKLRQAGVKRDGRSDATVLEVAVNVIPSAFSETVSFRRTVAHMVGGTVITRHGATTWTTGQTGTFGRNPEYVLGAVDESLEESLNEYLKANRR